MRKKRRRWSRRRTTCLKATGNSWNVLIRTPAAFRQIRLRPAERNMVGEPSGWPGRHCLPAGRGHERAADGAVLRLPQVRNGGRRHGKGLHRPSPRIWTTTGLSALSSPQSSATDVCLTPSREFLSRYGDLGGHYLAVSGQKLPDSGVVWCRPPPAPARPRHPARAGRHSRGAAAPTCRQHPAGA